MSMQQNLPFDSASNYTFDSNKVEVVAGKAQLKLVDGSPLSFNEDFVDDTGFTYDSTKTEFVVPVPLPENATFGANFSYGADANWGDGMLTGTPTGGATVAGGKLDLRGGTVKYVTYDAIGNANFTQTGAIRFKYTPNYSGFPASNRCLFTLTKDASSLNMITLYHFNSGTLHLYIQDKDNNVIVNAALGTWTPTAGVNYTFELNCDFTAGATRLFIDGVQKDTTKTDTGIRTNTANKFHIGTDNGKTISADAKYDDVVIFNTVQHTADYTPGYTVIDGAITEYSIQQLNQLPANATFGATFTDSIDGSWGDGTLTGTPTGGAIVSGGQLDLTGDTVQYVDYDADLNAGMQQVISFMLRIKPNYAGTPANTKEFFTVCKANGDKKNDISLRHYTNGHVGLYVVDGAGNVLFEAGCGLWSPSKDVLTELYVHVDLTAGDSRVFIDGIQQGSTILTTGTRDTNIGLLRIGSNYAGSHKADFSVESFVIYDTIQHTSNYTPSGTVPENEYVTDTITLPTFNYTGLGDIQTFTGFTTSETNAPKYIFNDLYWDGTTWNASDGTYTQSNTQAEVGAHIATLPNSNTIITKTVFPDSNTQSSVTDLTLDYTGQIYPSDNPTIINNSGVLSDALEGFTTIFTGDVQYVLNIDGQDKYWNTAAWVDSDGTYAQSNTSTEVEANIAILDISDGQTLKVKTFLHSDGTSTPNIDNITVSYSFYIDPDVPLTTKVYGWVRDVDSSGSEETTITFTPTEAFTYAGSLVMSPQTVTIDANGYFEINIVENTTHGGSYTIQIKYKRTRPKTYTEKVVPLQESISLGILLA